jgi:hypothetical protein
VRSLCSVLAVLSMLVLCGGSAQAQGQEPPPDVVIQVALDAVAAQLDVSEDNLVIVMSAQRDWPDTSLGCPGQGIAYAQIVTPGYIVTVDTDDLVTEVEVHTDQGARAAIC